MNRTAKFTLLGASGLGAFALLLLIISVGTPGWLDDYMGNTVGLFRQCTGANGTSYGASTNNACANANQVTQGGLTVFGLLLLAFAVIAGFAAAFIETPIIRIACLGLMYFSSMFVMAGYATWGTYSRDPTLYFYPSSNIVSSSIHYMSMGYSYHLCVAAHFFLWTALTILAFSVGVAYGSPEGTTG